LRAPDRKAYLVAPAHRAKKTGQLPQQETAQFIIHLSTVRIRFRSTVIFEHRKPTGARVLNIMFLNGTSVCKRPFPVTTIFALNDYMN